MPRIARPETINKKSNKKHVRQRRLTPQECRDVKAYWDETVETRAQERTGRNYDVKVGHHSYTLPWHIAKTIAVVQKPDRRNPGRRDGSTWNADSFICKGQIDGKDYYSQEGAEAPGEYTENEEEGEEEHEHEHGVGMPTTLISLTDMVRAAKPTKAKFQEFEMIPTVSRVIVVDDDVSAFSYPGWDDNLEYLDDEEWEQLESSDDSGEETAAPAFVRKSYAQVIHDSILEIEP